MPMSGFGARVDHFDSVHDPLLLTVLYSEHEGREAWLASADICQFPDGEAGRAGVEAVATQLGCAPSALFLNATHTHGGPLMSTNIAVPNPQKILQRGGANKALVERYREFLWKNLAAACEAARQNANKSTLRYVEGKTAFPMNRRALIDGKVELAPDPSGPFDDRLRLLALERDGKTRALGLVLACHPTATGPQHQITADFIAGWREKMREELGEEITFFFLQACGGDARPAYTRDGDSFRKVGLGEIAIMGEQLARETKTAMNGEWHELSTPLVRHASTTVALPCEQPWPTIESYRELAKSDSAPVRAYAENCVRVLESGGTLATEVPLDLRVFALDRDLVLAGGSCEFLYGIGRKIETQIEAEIPARFPVALGYTNGCFGYLPDKIELARGGYEAESYLWETVTGPFKPEAEDVILAGYRELLTRIGGHA
jgi:hypothetical protein